VLAIALKLAAPIILIVGGMHLVLGVQADVLLGAKIGLEVLRDPVLDSQNRFYGIVFTVYGFLLFLCATDLEKYQTVLRILLWVFFAAGCARLVSIATHGLPSELVLMLLATELVLPPICILWLKKALG
jgi:hypothetical protein